MQLNLLSSLLHFVFQLQKSPLAKFIDFHPKLYSHTLFSMNFKIYFQPFPEINIDETQTNGADVKVNGTDLDKQTPVTTQKYSQILGDHHSNNSTNQFSRNSSSNNIYKTRGYNNKENLYNQRAVGRPGVQRSWQRGGNYRTSFASERDKKPTENGSNEAKIDSTAEPIKFNEGESSTLLNRPHPATVRLKKHFVCR